MQAQPAFDTTFESRLAKIDLSRVMEKVAKETGMTTEELSVAEDLYRKFLTIKSENFDAELAPPVIVDMVWDMHVQFSRQYMADCDLLFGQYLHHEPHVESDDINTMSRFMVTQNIYQSQFGINFTRLGLRAELFKNADCF